MAELNIDATNLVVGRLASYVAKQALLGFTVNIFNCESAIISGPRNVIRWEFYRLMNETGMPTKGPFIYRLPDRFVRRIIRGMVDHRKPRGREAYARIMCYIGVPEKFKDRKLVKIGKEAVDLPMLKYQTVKELCSFLGGKV